MKKILFVLGLVVFGSLGFAETRTFYIARHGQRGSTQYVMNLKNCKDDRLMPKGERQAEQLGLYMKKIGFDGAIYVSPYYRTLQTGTIACNQFTSRKMIVDPEIQEVTGMKGTNPRGISKSCITKKEIKKYFPNVIIPKNMKFPWRYENERQSVCDERTNAVIEKYLKSPEDVFLVCHGGLLNSFVREMNKRGANFKKRTNYNCCLFSFTLDTETGLVTECSDRTFEYLSDDLITDNLGIVILQK